MTSSFLDLRYSERVINLLYGVVCLVTVDVDAGRLIGTEENARFVTIIKVE